MILNVNDNARAFLEIKQCISVCRRKVIHVTPEVIRTSNQTVSVVFSTDTTVIEPGTYKVAKGGQHKFLLKEWEDQNDSVFSLPDDMDWQYDTTYSHKEDIFDKTGVVISDQINKLLYATQHGKPADIMFAGPTDPLIISCGNVTITVTTLEAVGPVVTKNVTGIPEHVFKKLESYSLPATQIVRSKIAEKVKQPIGPVSQAPEVEKTSKLINGMPLTTLKTIKAYAAAEGISANSLILNILESWLPSESAPLPKPLNHCYTKLIPGIPKGHAKALKAHAAAEGISVNRLILGLLEEV